MAFARKSKEHVKENITFDFAKESDFKSFEELKSKAVKDKRKRFLEWFPEKKQLKEIEQEQKEFQKAKESVKTFIRRKQEGKADNILAKTQFGKSIVLVAKDRGKVIGFQEILIGGKRPLIKFNYILPAYRRRGIASSFHGLSQLMMAEAGFKSIEIGYPINKAARKALDKAKLPRTGKERKSTVKVFKRGSR